MRVVAFAVLLFAAGFGIVSIGQQASAFFGHSRIFDRPGAPPLITGSVQPRRPETYADYVTAANRAFADMDRTCSAAHREALGQAFHELLNATRALHSGRIEAGHLKPETARNIADAKADMVLASAASSSELGIFAQVIDASQRGVLTAGDFPLGMAKLMLVQMKLAQRKRNRATLQQGRNAAFSYTRCLPM